MEVSDENCSHHSPTILGIDIGTSSVKLAVIKIRPNAEPVILETVCRAYNNPALGKPIKLKESTQTNEQDVGMIMKSIGSILKEVSPQFLRNVKSIAIAGQMHGLVGWNVSALRMARHMIEPDSETTASQSFHKHCSKLVTWMDQRCSAEFLESLCKPMTGPPVASGYGCATLAWFKQHQPTEFANSSQTETFESSDKMAPVWAHGDQNHPPWTCAGTIADFIVCVLVNSDRPVMSPQMAASWGYFDVKCSNWELDRLNSMGFPTHLLPSIVRTGTVVGKLNQPWYHIPVNATVYVAMGDLQSSAFAALRQPNTAVCNLSTSAQLCFPVPKQITPEDYLSPTVQDLGYCATKPTIQEANNPPTASRNKFNCQLWPYFDDHVRLAVSASLNGGNVLDQFVQTIQSWIQDLGLEHLAKAKIFERLNNLSRAGEANMDPEPGLIIVPTLFGERHCPDQFMSIYQIQPSNLKLGTIYCQLCQAIVSNLINMVPRQLLQDCQIKRMVCSGGLIAQNPQLFEAMTKQFPEFEVLISPFSTDACVGASLYVASLQDH